MQPETADLMLDRAILNYSIKNIDTEKTLLLWLEQFDKVDDALIKDAFNLTLKRCKFFPTVADIEQSLMEIRQQKRTEGTPKALEQGQKQWNSKPIEFIVNAMKTGTIHDIAQKVDISKAVAYAKTLWPEIAEDIVRMNFCEIEQCRQESEMCNACSWTPADCLAGGYHNSMRLEPTGFVHLTMVPCRKRVS